MCPLPICIMITALPHVRKHPHTNTHTQLYLHGEGSSLLVVMVQQVGHEGGVVWKLLAHPQSNGLAAERTVAVLRLHMDGRAGGEEKQGDEEQELLLVVVVESSTHLHTSVRNPHDGRKGGLLLPICSHSRMDVSQLMDGEEECAIPLQNYALEI